MNDWIGLGIFVAVAVLAYVGLRQLSKPVKRTEAEFERRAEEGRGAVGALANALQKAFDPAAERGTVEVQKLKQGRYNKKKDQGDGSEEGEEEENDGKAD